MSDKNRAYVNWKERFIAKRGVLRRLLILLAACGLLPGCEQPTNLPSGNWTVRVYVSMYDEFNRPIPAVGPFGVTLFAKDRLLTGTIPADDSVYAFVNLPYQAYASSVTRSGCFPSLNSGGPFDVVYGSEGLINIIYPTPSAQTRIDSIQCVVNSITPKVQFHVFTAQTVPSGGSRSIALFVGLAGDVSSRFGSYVYTNSAIVQTAGSSDVVSDDLYEDMHTSGITPGMNIFVTARILSGATTTAVDTRSGLVIYDNIENNTRAVVSMVMP